MDEVQFSIFDIPLPPEAPAVEVEIVEEGPQNTPAPDVSEPETKFEFDFDCTVAVPNHPKGMSILSIGDKVAIIPGKYGVPAKSPGIVKAFLPTAGIVVRRRDGEALYERYELYKI